MRVFYLNLFVSLALIISGFFVPSVGIIDGSVLTAVGLLLMFGVIAQILDILNAVRAGKSIKLQKGDLELGGGFGTRITLISRIISLHH